MSGAELLARRRERIKHIRQTVAALTAAAFLALFGGIYAQMVAGKDPALGTSVVAKATTSTSASSGTDDEATSRPRRSSSSSTDSPPAVTTSQS